MKRSEWWKQENKWLSEGELHTEAMCEWRRTEGEREREIKVQDYGEVQKEKDQKR